jgi:hypothetical protein
MAAPLDHQDGMEGLQVANFSDPCTFQSKLIFFLLIRLKPMKIRLYSIIFIPKFIHKPLDGSPSKTGGDWRIYMPQFHVILNIYQFLEAVSKK